MPIYLPIASNSVSALGLVGLGALVGLMSGLFGVGGGFLMTPLLIMIGIPPTIAAASDSNQIVAASASGSYAHFRAGNVDLKIGILMLLGGLAGGTIGVQIIKLLRALGEANFVITVVYVLMLGSVGSYMFFESLGALRGRTRAPAGTKMGPSLQRRMAEALPLRMNFPRSGVRMSVLMPLGLGVIVGLLAAIMGVGGGFIMVPVMVYLLRMPMHVVVGTSLFQILFTCINVTILQSTINHTVDFILALLLLVGSVIGAQIGVRIGRRLKGDQLKILLSVVVLAVCAKMLLGLLLRPDVLVAYPGGH
jgi:uncharacterized membrane protein YfcA